MAREPVLSIITPVFNGEKHIADCIENVLAQGVEGVEHIIVDGGSTDATLALIEQYMANHAHVRLLPGPDRGQSDALNKGIRAARSRIVGILNCDDFYEPGVLARIVDLFEGKPEPSLLVGNCLVHNEVAGNRWINRPSNLRIEHLLVGVDFVPCPSNPSAYFYHKSLHDVVGPYDIDEDFAMDLEFILGAVQECRYFYYDEHWGNYLYHSETKTFKDKTIGTQESRRRNIYKKYYRGLSLRQKTLTNLLKIEYRLKHKYWDICRALGTGARR